MSRLLQALKNLEARSPKPAAGRGLLNHLADTYHAPSPDPPVSTHADVGDAGRPTPIKPQPLDNPLAYLSTGVPTILLPSEPPEPALPSRQPEPEFCPPPSAPVASELPPTPPVAVPTPALDRVERALSSFPQFDRQPAPAPVEAPRALVVPPPEPVAPSRTATPPRQPTLLERAIRRTLADPQRSEPFRRLAERLKADLDQVAGRSILITGVGPASDSHEATLHAAAILAEAGEPVLVIDGDAARHTLTTQLDLTGGTGLAELARGEEPDADPILPTTFENLSVLPFGKVRMSDPASAANRLAALIQSLEGSYRLILIDGGRTADPAVAELSRLCDATYFVVRLGETDATVAQTALRDFRAAGARILGCIATS
jgi:protein-tyrosine kinase